MRIFSIVTLLGVVLTLAGVGVTSESYANAEPAARTAAQLYGRHCASCHGRDGRAKTTKAKFNHARDISDGRWQDDVSDERIFNSIMNGRSVRGNMPAFKNKITENEIDSLVTYVRGLRK